MGRAQSLRELSRYRRGGSQSSNTHGASCIMRNLNWLVGSVVVLLLFQIAPGWSQDDHSSQGRGNPGGIDFQIQGEYQGDLAVDESTWGVQIVANGDGKFRSVGYFGGLPGDGWTPGAEKVEAEGRLEGSVAVFDVGEFVARIDGKTLKIESLDGEQLGELTKVVRKSSTLGAKPPEGAVVLFDGSSVEAWVNGKLTDDHLLAATGVETKESFGDHSLHVEFRLPFMPKASGQGRGNSGVYVQSRYEIQVLDSFGLEGRDNECGGIYSISPPALNMCYPPLTWQTYDIDFRAARFNSQGEKTENARITVRHNGVVIHDNRELPHPTPGRLGTESADPAPLYLQDHGNPVVFRNIWVVKK